MLLLMAATGLFASSLSYGLALSIRDEGRHVAARAVLHAAADAARGMMLPISLAPEWMRTAARFNPLYYAVEAGRALFADPSSPTASIPLAFGLFLASGRALPRLGVRRSMKRIAGLNDPPGQMGHGVSRAGR